MRHLAIFVVALVAGCASSDRAATQVFEPGDLRAPRPTVGVVEVGGLIVDPASVVVYVDAGNQPLGAWQAVLVFDPAVVAVDRVGGGEAPGFTGPPAADPAQFASGRLRLLAYQVGQPPAVGRVPVARVWFRPVSAGVVDLSIETEAVADGTGATADGRALLSARSVTVSTR